MLAPLSKPAEVDADYTFAPTFLPALQLLVNIKKAWGHFKEHLILIVADGLKPAQIAPKVLCLFHKLIYRPLKISITGGDIEVEASKYMDAVFFPVLGERNDFVEHHDAPILGRCLSTRLGVLAGESVHLGDLGCR